MAEQPVIEIVLPTYRLSPEENERFYPSKARDLALQILKDELDNQNYDEEDAKTWSLNISDKVREAVQETMKGTRYKIVVQTTVGQQKDQGVRIASRCFWDPSTDNYATAQYSNATIFCNVMIFCLYTD